jgi:hypothetical protein
MMNAAVVHSAIPVIALNALHPRMPMFASSASVSAMLESSVARNAAARQRALLAVRRTPYETESAFNPRHVSGADSVTNALSSRRWFQ